MLLFPTRLLLFSLFLLVLGCASDYKMLQPISVDQECLGRTKPPELETSWYTAGVDVVGRHLSGLLLIKVMPDETKRIVFTNESGVTLFDLGFGTGGTFTVHSIIPQLDKKAVVGLLRDDFSLLLGLPFKSEKWVAFSTEGEKYIGVAEKKEMHYIISDGNCSALRRLETGSKRKRKLTIALNGNDMRKPDSIVLQHHTFEMKIELKKIER
jgi:hypothetical protein